MEASAFLKRHGATRIEDLGHKELVQFAIDCMDDVTSASITRLMAGGFGIAGDPLPQETDKAIIEAFHKGLSLTASYVECESYNGSGNSGKPGFKIELVRLP